MDRRYIITLAAAMCGVAALAQPALSEVTPQEAEKLKTVLTPVGAERAGNKDGSIPAWEGGYTKVDPNWKPGTIRPDAFSAEKPLFSISSANAGKYADKLSEGTRVLMEKNPDFRIDVYPTHRSATVPSWVADNIFKNATRAKTANNGLSVDGGYGGVPFPIPKDGFEAMWNHILAWRGDAVREKVHTYTVNDGKVVLTAETVIDNFWPYYQKDASETSDGNYFKIRLGQTAPAYKAGEGLVAHDPLDYVGKNRQVWQYLTGQRRVRKAPSVAYDGPDYITSGVANWDESYVFSGAMDRYDWKLVGKQEMFVPYNNNKFATGKYEDVLGPRFLNPDYVRWELHRVWVVEATLASGKRNVITKRRFYLDEDTWLAVLADEWDANGKLWKLGYCLLQLAPDMPGMIPRPWGTYNLQTGAYLMNSAFNGSDLPYVLVKPWPDTHFTPAALSGEGQ